jgi:hypothetical protein
MCNALLFAISVIHEGCAAVILTVVDLYRETQALMRACYLSAAKDLSSGHINVALRPGRSDPHPTAPYLKDWHLQLQERPWSILPEKPFHMS